VFSAWPYMWKLYGNFIHGPIFCCKNHTEKLLIQYIIT
jgi:hypothetical protein